MVRTKYLLNYRSDIHYYHMSDEIKNLSGKESIPKFIGLAEAAKLSGLSHAHLRRFVANGRIWGIKIGRDWMTTEKAIRDYLATNPKPGPKSKLDS
ncbi:MAG: DNA-binding protein [Chloroflexi bacterium]|nr:MAG: DNA-binding protein [Chloroflexota bacterium]